MVSEIAPGSTLGRVRRLGGGLATETFAFDLQGAGNGGYVVKRYRADDETAPSEWERLVFAQRVRVPVPEPMALNAEGSWFGVPALVMKRLPGRAEIQPADVDTWLRELALALATIHETSLAGAQDALLKAPHAETWEPPAGLRTSALSNRVVAAIEQYLPRATWDPALTHGDFHPGNVLWRRQAISGVADWSMARAGPRWYELAYLRADVVLLLGVAGADRLTDLYVSVIGQDPVDLPVFDLICGLRARRWAALWLTAYREQGLTDTPRGFAARLTPYLRRALAALGA
jgi:aminoglycoside phosphotransferase (APT) family kinase protein